ncbi:MAG: hypothetical protein R3Y24_05300 [Eubacteriales bacterium]
MSNYFDNQDKWSWQISNQEAFVTTDHGSHTHTIEVTDVPIGDMSNHTGQVMGDAHRAASHDFKDGKSLIEDRGNNISDENMVENITVDNVVCNNHIEECSVNEAMEGETLECGEDCEDGLDI